MTAMRLIREGVIQGAARIDADAAALPIARALPAVPPRREASVSHAAHVNHSFERPKPVPVSSPQPLRAEHKQPLMRLLESIDRQAIVELFPVQAAERFDIDSFSDMLISQGGNPDAALFGVWTEQAHGEPQLAGLGRIRPDGCGNMIAEIAVGPGCDSEEATQKLLLAQIDHAQRVGAPLLRMPRVRTELQTVIVNVAVHLRLEITTDYRLMDRAGGRPSMDLRLPISDLR